MHNLALFKYTITYWQTPFFITLHYLMQLLLCVTKTFFKLALNCAWKTKKYLNKQKLQIFPSWPVCIFAQEKHLKTVLGRATLIQSHKKCDMILIVAPRGFYKKKEESNIFSFLFLVGPNNDCKENQQRNWRAECFRGVICLRGAEERKVGGPL